MKEKNDALTKKDREKAIDEIVRLFFGGMESVHAAGRKLVEHLDRDPMFKEYFRKEHPNFSRDTLDTLENIGRGTVHAELLFDTSPGGKRAVLLPYSTQKTLLDKGVEVVHKIGDKTIVEVKPLAALTQAEVLIVFEASHILSVEEQTKRLEHRSIKTRPARAAYEIGEDGVVVPYRFLTWAQVLELAKHAPKSV